jgi:hypothetical protein
MSGFQRIQIVINGENCMNVKDNVTIKSFFVAALVGGLFLSFAGNASATLSLDYSLDSSNPLASITYNSSTGCLSGSDIAVTAITGIGTTQTNPNTLAVTGGQLNFVTGPLTGITGGNTWNFSPGGSITVTGSITPLITNATLLSGAFESLSVTEMPLPQSGLLTFAIVGGTISGVGTQPVYSYFNIPSVSASASGLNLSFLATSGISINSLNSAGIASGNIFDTPISSNSDGGTVPTPIPAAAWLFGSGLMGLAGLRNRKFSKD